MGRKLRMEITKGRFILDPLSIFLALMAFLIGFIVYVFNPQTFQGTLGLFIAMISLVGLFFGVTILKSPIDRILDEREMGHIIRWSMLGFILIIALQMLIFETYNISALVSLGIYNKLFLMAVAIGETFFFRFAILQLFYQYFKGMPASLWIASIATSIIFTTYHGYVYGTIPVAMMAVFASSMILCVVTILSNRIAVPIISHMMVNLVAG